MADFLPRFISDFARGISLADGKRPRAKSQRSGVTYQAGIGPHSEAQTIQLVMSELSNVSPERYAGQRLNVPYPATPRLTCDVHLVSPPHEDWWLEAKLLRLLGDNGKVNDNILMHILSPYPDHRSALTDCAKLIRGQPPGRRGIFIFGYDSDRWPMDPAISAFEALARAFGYELGDRITSEFGDLIHPVHQRGRVFGWEIVN